MVDVRYRSCERTGGDRRRENALLWLCRGYAGLFEGESFRLLCPLSSISLTRISFFNSVRWFDTARKVRRRRRLRLRLFFALLLSFLPLLAYFPSSTLPPSFRTSTTPMEDPQEVLLRAFLVKAQVQARHVPPPPSSFGGFGIFRESP